MAVHRKKMQTHYVMYAEDYVNEADQLEHDSAQIQY